MVSLPATIHNHSTCIHKARLPQTAIGALPCQPICHVTPRQISSQSWCRVGSSPLGEELVGWSMAIAESISRSMELKGGGAGLSGPTTCHVVDNGCCVHIGQVPSSTRSIFLLLFFFFLPLFPYILRLLRLVECEGAVLLVRSSLPNVLLCTPPSIPPARFPAAFRI